MSEEFKVAVGWYLLKHSPKFATPQIPHRFEIEIDNDYLSEPLSCSNDGGVSNSSSSKGPTFSSAGPAHYVGDILEHPDMLWTEDSWTDDKERSAIERIREQGTDASPYWRNHYEVQAGRYWHQFYQRNKDHFYKDRHYLHIVFPELQHYTADITTRLLEVGCGVGNAALPLLEINPHLHITAIDFANSAIQILQNHITTLRDDYRTRITARVNNVATDEPPVDVESMDLVLCMFVLSAMAKEIHLNVFKKLCSLLKPGGKLLIRDYGR